MRTPRDATALYVAVLPSRLRFLFLVAGSRWLSTVFTTSGRLTTRMGGMLVAPLSLTPCSAIDQFEACCLWPPMATASPPGDAGSDDDDTCHICHDIMEDPVTLGCPCGKSFCHVCAISWHNALPDHGARPCPFCRGRIEGFFPNIRLAAHLATVQRLCRYAGSDGTACAMRGTLADCTAHEINECPLRASAPTWRAGYYVLYSCDPHHPDHVVPVMANDLHLERPPDAGTGEFQCGSVFGCKWWASGRMRRNGQGYYIWESDTNPGITAVRLLENGDVFGSVYGDVSAPGLSCRWCYRGVWQSASPPAQPPDDLDETDAAIPE